MHRSLKTVALVATLALVGLGCGDEKKPTGNDYGVFRSANSGETWGTASAVLTTSGTKESLHTFADIRFLVQDPVNHEVMYAGTNKGLWVTENAGVSWIRPTSAVMQNAAVLALAVNPKESCEVYAAVENAIQKTEDCGRTWKAKYTKNEAVKSNQPDIFRSLAIDPTDTNVLYAGTRSGALMKSVDGGDSWNVKRRLNTDTVQDIFVHPNNHNVIFMAGSRSGLFRSDDAGDTWSDITPVFKLKKNDAKIHSSAAFSADGEVLIVASKRGLSRTTDNGATWEELPLINAPGTELIFSVAINPTKSEEIYYGTLTGFYRSADAGQNWQKKAIPTTKAVSAILIDKGDANVVYLGARNITVK